MDARDAAALSEEDKMRDMAMIETSRSIGTFCALRNGIRRRKTVFIRATPLVVQPARQDARDEANTEACGSDTRAGAW